MRVTWSPQAIDDLASLRAYISQDHPAAAKRIALHIVHCVEELLVENPALGHPGRVSGTRELIIAKTPFIVPYRTTDAAVEILRVYHQAQRWPDRL
jgi:toxin ParE1/3/4